MLKDELQAKLDTVAPAIAATNIIPLFINLWFTGTHLVAHNDTIAISVPLKTGFTGGVPGKLLVDLLAATSVENVNLAVEGKSILGVSAGSATRLRLPLTPIDDFNKAFRMPSAPKTEALGSKHKPILLASIEHCMRAVITDPGRPNYSGMTVTTDNAHASLYGTTGSTLAYAGFDIKGHLLPKRMVLHELFCNQLLRLTGARQRDAEDEDKKTKKDDAVAFGFWCAEKHVLAHVGDAMLFGKLMQQEAPPNFERVYESNIEGAGDFFPCPDTLPSIATRAAIVAGNERTAVVADNGKVTFHTETSTVVTDVMTCKGHPKAKINIVAKHLAKAAQDFDSFVITDKAFALGRSDSDRVYLIGGV